MALEIREFVTGSWQIQQSVGGRNELRYITMALYFQARAGQKVDQRIIKTFMVKELGKGWSEREREMERNILDLTLGRKQSALMSATSLPQSV